MSWGRAKFVALLVAVVTCWVGLAGCKPYRIEYHNRPAYYAKVADGPLPDQVTLDDGTVIVYGTHGKKGTYRERAESEETFKVRERLEDGSVALRAVLPEHVLGNTLTCLQNEEYELLWDQLISERTKMAYAEQGQGVEEFAAFFKKHRNDLAKTLNRMLIGIATGETVVSQNDLGVLEVRFWPQVASQFTFKRVDVVREHPGMKLVLIY